MVLDHSTSELLVTGACIQLLTSGSYIILSGRMKNTQAQVVKGVVDIPVLLIHTYVCTLPRSSSTPHPTETGLEQMNVCGLWISLPV